MKSDINNKIFFITGGGTGGHVTPGLAIARAQGYTPLTGWGSPRWLRKGVSVLTPEPEAGSTDVGKLAARAGSGQKRRAGQIRSLFAQRVPGIRRDALFYF